MLFRLLVKRPDGDMGPSLLIALIASCLVSSSRLSLVSWGAKKSNSSLRNPEDRSG